MRKHVSIIFLLSACVILSQGCHVGTSGTWKNDRIDENVKDKIDVLNKKLFKSIATKDIVGIKQLMSPILIEKSGKKIDTLINNIDVPSDNPDYRLLDEYYTKNTATNISNTLFSNKGNDNDYTIQYEALNEEMYVSILTSEKLPANFMILAIYGKYENEWKLNILQVGDYTLLDKTAPDYYNAALKEYNKGYIIDAADLIIIASEIANPANDYFKYKNEGEMKDFYSKVLKEANTQYKFPIIVNQVKSNPQIFAINPQFIGNGDHKGIFPIVKYKSSIELKDTVALKVENDAMQKVIGSIFRGIDQDKSNIIYQAFNQIPDGKTIIKHYGFIQNLK